MVNKDEISSTEKLLDLIRNHDSTSPSADDDQPLKSPLTPTLFRTLAFKRAVSIGVEIGNRELRIAKINRLSDKSFELLDYASVRIEESAAYESPQLAKTLATVLFRFCKGLKRYDIWCCTASANVETRCIRIPKLPRKQIANAVFWTFSKEVSFNQKEMMLDFRVLGDVNDNGMVKTEVMAFTIPIAQTDALKRLFIRIGYPLTGISIVPFAIQNLLKTGIVKGKGRNTCCLFIGRDWSRITIYANGNLVLSRAIKAGMHSMIDAIAKADGRPAPDRQVHEPDADPGPPDREAGVIRQDDAYHAARDIFRRFLDGTDTGSDGGWGHLDVHQAILPPIERLVKQVERTNAHFCMHFHQNGVNDVLISGRVTAIPAVVEEIESLLGTPVRVLNPFPADHVFTQTVTVPDAAVDKESFVPAIGIGLASNDLTPNFLFTHRHRERRVRSRRIRIAMSAASIGFLFLLFGGFLWQENRIVAKTHRIEQLTSEKDAFNVPLTQDLVTALLSKVNKKRASIATLGDRYLGSAIIAEVSQLTPKHIQLITLNIDLGVLSGKAHQREKATMMIEGIVTGEPIRFETDLASYMLTVESSILFKTPTVRNKRLQFLDNRQVMRFSIEFELA